jgi:hypothetical protein
MRFKMISNVIRGNEQKEEKKKKTSNNEGAKM